ncbi:MAG TPA: hypothetical protein VM076_06700 [Gemmatimonadaceae bacterium]|nr:hypothetical protein [Gemmatimonadaceae bacterium]
MSGALRLWPLPVALTLACLACGGADEPTGTIPAGATLTLTVNGLLPIDAASGGRYEAWVTDRSGTAHTLGTVAPGAGASRTFASPVGDPASFLITFEPRADTDPGPSAHRLLIGTFRGGHAQLTVQGAVTAADQPLRERPGQFTMFSPSDNFRNGYPSHEEAGIWLFNMAPRETQQGDMWVRLTQLQPGWVYEGWMVRDIDSPGAVWLSYGKFLPDVTGTVNSRDDTGWGEFSGVTDFLKGEEEFPGDDWIANPLGYTVPGGLTLPLNLREKTAAGVGRWTHLITIEPSSDRGEAVTTPRPFAIRPYRDPFGDGAPGSPRTITFRGDGVPRGEVVAR